MGQNVASIAVDKALQAFLKVYFSVAIGSAYR